MTTPEDEEYEDSYPLLGAIGPYLSFTTGPMNPLTEEDFAPFVDDNEEMFFPEDLTDTDNDPYWEEDEK
jgi:hypothetical protein